MIFIYTLCLRFVYLAVCKSRNRDCSVRLALTFSALDILFLSLIQWRVVKYFDVSSDIADMAFSIFSVCVLELLSLAYFHIAIFSYIERAIS